MEDAADEDMMKNKPYFNRIRLVPNMNFTCRGKITRVMMVGKLRNGTQGMKLHIWRKDGNENGIYQRSGREVRLSPDICTESENSTTLFNCQLPKMMQVSVEPGDILGIELPPQNLAAFEPYSVSEPGLTNYIFRYNQLSSTIDFCSAFNRSPAFQPLVTVMIRMKKSPGISETVT